MIVLIVQFEGLTLEVTRVGRRALPPAGWSQLKVSYITLRAFRPS